MQIFVPVPDLAIIADCLDDKRLGAMRRESRQVYDTILMRPTKKGTPRVGYVNHPIVKMWRGFENAVLSYSNVMIEEWVKRGKNNTMEIVEIKGDIVFPPWWGRDDVHAAHRSNLYHKFPRHYEQFGWAEASLPLLGYVWVDPNDALQTSNITKTLAPTG
jgi:hypothetical protein